MSSMHLVTGNVTLTFAASVKSLLDFGYDGTIGLMD